MEAGGSAGSDIDPGRQTTLFGVRAKLPDGCAGHPWQAEGGGDESAGGIRGQHEMRLDHPWSKAGSNPFDAAS
jgi:hypothetical protein